MAPKQVDSSVTEVVDRVANKTISTWVSMVSTLGLSVVIVLMGMWFAMYVWYPDHRADVLAEQESSNKFRDSIAASNASIADSYKRQTTTLDSLREVVLDQVKWHEREGDSTARLCELASMQLTSLDKLGAAVDKGNKDRMTVEAAATLEREEVKKKVSEVSAKLDDWRKGK